jgi:xylulokinase
MAQRSGLLEGTPVAAGCGDTAASFLSSGAYAEGNTVDVAGTASVVASSTSKFRPDTKSKVLGVGQSTIPGLWHPYAYINGGGMNLEWFKTLVNEQRGTELDFEDMEKLAQNVTIKHSSPVFVPHMSGRVMPSDAAMRGTWFGLTRDLGVGALYASVLEGVALEYRLYVDALRALYPEVSFDEMRVTGGGETSPFWNQLKATACNLSVTRVAGSRGAPMGSAIVAGCAAGLWKNPEQPAKEWLSFESAASPDPEKHNLYEKRFKSYRYALQFASEYARRMKEE